MQLRVCGYRYLFQSYKNEIKIDTNCVNNFLIMLAFGNRFRFLFDLLFQHFFCQSFKTYQMYRDSASDKCQKNSDYKVIDYKIIEIPSVIR